MNTLIHGQIIYAWLSENPCRDLFLYEITCFYVFWSLQLKLSMNGCRKAKVSCTKKREFNSKIRIFLKDFLALLKSLHVKNFIEKKSSWYDMRPLNQIGLVRKLEVVHKQVGGFMRRLYGQWRGYVVTSCRCYVVRYVGIELLGQLKRKTDNHFIFIGPESDHCLLLSLTHWLTDRLTDWLTPV